MPTWQVVMPAADLWAGELTGVQLGRKKIVLANVGGEIRAFEDRCPHLGFQLSEGNVDGRTLTCANHQWDSTERPRSSPTKARRPPLCGSVNAGRAIRRPG